MFEGLQQLLAPRPWPQLAADALDILIVAYLVYRVLLVLRGTRAMQMGIGLLFLGAIYVLGRWMGLVTLTTLLSTLLSSVILVVVVVFQNDLRRALMRAGRPLLGGLVRNDETKVIEEVVAAASELARLRYGAIITWEREANLDEFVVGAGTALDAQVTRELLVSIFIPVGENKLHDGSVIIRNLRLAQAGVFFPMPEKLGLDKKFGSRHRAAIGITAETDAVSIVVSEERGTIMFCFQENHVDNVSPEQLRNLLRHYEAPRKLRKSAPAPPRRSIAPPPASSRAAPSGPVTLKDTPPRESKVLTGPVLALKPPSARPTLTVPEPAPVSVRDPKDPKESQEAKIEYADRPPAPARPSRMPPPLDSAPPEEGGDQ
jgi:diadenylate cyclase